MSGPNAERTGVVVQLERIAVALERIAAELKAQNEASPIPFAEGPLCSFCGKSLDDRPPDSCPAPWRHPK